MGISIGLPQAGFKTEYVQLQGVISVLPHCGFIMSGSSDQECTNATFYVPTTEYPSDPTCAFSLLGDTRHRLETWMCQPAE